MKNFKEFKESLNQNYHIFKVDADGKDIMVDSNLNRQELDDFMTNNNNIKKYHIIKVKQTNTGKSILYGSNSKTNSFELLKKERIVSMKTFNEFRLNESAENNGIHFFIGKDDNKCNMLYQELKIVEHNKLTDNDDLYAVENGKPSLNEKTMLENGMVPLAFKLVGPFSKWVHDDDFEEKFKNLKIALVTEKEPEKSQGFIFIYLPSIIKTMIRAGGTIIAMSTKNLSTSDFKSQILPKL